MSEMSRAPSKPAASKQAAKRSPISSAATSNGSMRAASAGRRSRVLAENFSDGIVAPAFWIAVLGPAGGFLHKAINTADSMIGHRTERHAAFGFASAKLDDLVNLVPARLAATWICLAAGGNISAAWRITWRDASGHPSPNAGWPEAAMAGALGIRLGGPRTYAARRLEDAWIGEGRSDLAAADILRALRVYRRACAVNFGALALIAVAALMFIAPG